MTIDFRSDTVTRPVPAMLQAMVQAKLGDDVFGEDPTVNLLEEKMADMFGMESAVFCPSGTMTNQIAIKCHTQPGDEVICDELSHIYQYEGGGIAFNSGCSVKLLKGDLGRIAPAQIKYAVNNRNDAHRAYSKLVSLENTSNRGGGSCYDFETFGAIRKTCDEHDLKLHLDGARMFNAIIAKNEKPADYGKVFHSISVCLSKGLGTPAGSVLISDKTFIAKARRIRKVFGGGMRQAGILAAAGIYALDNHVERLADDHTHAKMLADVVAAKEFTAHVLPAETNIVIFEVKENIQPKELLAKLKEKDILATAISPTQIRMVTHHDISREMILHTMDAIEKL